ncbi:hypothetical protein DITRI_Ditri13aG0155100 [Diplodiscus trichospermus]
MNYYLCSFLGFLQVLKKSSPHRQSSELLEGRRRSDLPEDTCHRFSLAEIKAATNNFHPESIIGYGGFGGFGCVYRGTVHNESIIAIKRLQTRSHGGVEEFRNEALLLCQLRHPHLVSLLGFCDEQNEMILVYEYMSRGSLSDYLFGKTYDPLCWKQRLKICIGVARGLHYLHTGAKRAVFHCDIKSSNILLDDDGSSKITDFASSKLMGPLSKSKPLLRMESRVVGTHGYMAPEYAMDGELTEKADVFSFGVVLFEVLCGRKSCNRELPEHLLINWASEFIREGTIYHVIDPYLQGNIASDCFKEYLEIACSCVHNNRNERPDMGEVEVTLELVLKLQEKADSEMEGINISHGECMYKDPSTQGKLG